MTGAKKHRRKASDINVAIESKAWTNALRTSAACVRRAAAAALESARPRPELLSSQIEVSVLLTTDAAVQRLNAEYRGLNNPTNVLSFPAYGADEAPSSTPGAPVLLGDVVLAFATTQREARAEGKTFAAHLSHLVVHGVLHLLGYDHERENDAIKMERLETMILAGLGIADPYATASARPKKPGKRKIKVGR